MSYSVLLSASVRPLVEFAMGECCSRFLRMTGVNKNPDRWDTCARSVSFFCKFHVL